MKIRVLADAEAVAKEAAVVIAAAARAAVEARGLFVMAISGGRTPWMMLRALSAQDMPWEKIHIFQVDERIAPADHQDRNLTHLREGLVPRAALSPEHLHAMPVEDSDLDAAVARYADTLRVIAGSPPVLDLIHLGLGSDGHTASLIPGDPVLEVKDTDVALTGTYQGRRRMTLTLPILNRARFILWLVTGQDKRDTLAHLRAGDRSIPAGRISHDRALLLADRAAAGA